MIAGAVELSAQELGSHLVRLALDQAAYRPVSSNLERRILSFVVDAGNYRRKRGYGGLRDR